MPQAALVEPLRPWDPEQVGGFVLLGRLGAGAMGQVYLGRSAAGRLVAVKTIKTGLAEEPDFRTRFGQEVAAARRVSGAFTAAVVAADAEADVPWLATVYVPAPSLAKLVRTCGPMSVQAVRWLAAGCAEALESIHGVGLVQFLDAEGTGRHGVADAPEELPAPLGVESPVGLDERPERATWA